MTKTTELEATLRERFGLEAFRGGQRQVIEALLAGRSAAAVFPTGGGKSLCYQLPALLLEGVTLVVSPLIALMKDQIDALQRLGIAAARLDSSLPAAAWREVHSGLRDGTLRLLYVAPERFNNERFRELITGVNVSLFAIDEAHCISEWGHNFRPDYLKLARFASSCGAKVRLALTATATPQVLADIQSELGIADEDAVRSSSYRPNLELLPTPVKGGDRDALLVERLRTRPRGPTIVYVSLQRTAERVSQQLSEAGFPAEAYHAGMKAELRAEVQDRFLASSDGVVVATIAFGMGIDKSDIRYVYHYNLPKSLEHLSQEIGRAGRDGEPAICEQLACADDLGVLENFIYGDTPERAAIERLVALLFQGYSEGELRDLAFGKLAGETDIRVLVVRTLLTYLELEGWIAGGTPRYATYRFQPMVPSAEILAQFEGPERDLLRAILTSAKKARTWFTIDCDEAVQAVHDRGMRTTRENVIRWLDLLAENEWLELTASNVHHRYILQRIPLGEAREALIDELSDRMLEREQAELERLAEVVAFVEADACQVAVLCEHFGETRAPCGHCGHCEHGARALPPRVARELDPERIERALALADEHEILRQPRPLARFLCGLSSPGIGRARLRGHELFGAQARVPFAELLEATTAGLAGR